MESSANVASSRGSRQKIRRNGRVLVKFCDAKQLDDASKAYAKPYQISKLAVRFIF